MSLKSRRRQLPSEWWQIIYPKSVLHHLSSMGMFVQCQNSWWHVSTSLKSLQHTPLSSKYWHHFSLHLQSLDKDSLHLQLLVGIFEILMSGYSAMHPWCLSYVALKNWCNFDASASANVECCRGFMTKMNIGTALVQMKFWCGFINIGTDLMRMKCWRSFMAKMDVGTTLVWIKCWRGFMIKMNFGTALVWMKCCHGFMTEMNFGMTSVWMKCCHGFTTKTTVGTTSVQMMVWLQYECKC